jgi:hypothetical protein
MPIEPSFIPDALNLFERGVNCGASEIARSPGETSRKTDRTTGQYGGEHPGFASAATASEVSPAQESDTASHCR